MAAAFLAGGLLECVQAVETVASAPQGVTLTVYDTGMGLVHERRRVNLAGGENTVTFQQLPARLDPATVSLSPSPDARGLQILEQQFLYDLGDPEYMLQRYMGRKVNVETDAGVRSGLLLGVPSGDRDGVDDASVVLGAEDGSTLVYPDVRALRSMVFPQATRKAYLEPTLVWRLSAKEEGPKNIRLNYATAGISWHAAYELVLDEQGKEGYLSGRVGIVNHSGGAFDKARVRLITTEKGIDAASRERHIDVLVVPERRSGALRYPYGSDVLTFESWVVGLAPQSTYEMPMPLTLENGQVKYLELFKSERLPITRFYVYDGAKFDRFKRNRRNDWNYGTEYHKVVSSHLQFENVARVGLGEDLAPGSFRLYQRRPDGSVDLLGEDFLGPTAGDDTGHIRLGVARGLVGERERTGYSEVVPLHEYEETFEIRLINDSTEEVEIRVVEHLYRWDEFEIVKADTEYSQTGPQTIEFRPVLKPGGKRSIHYTVRYSW